MATDPGPQNPAPLPTAPNSFAASATAGAQRTARIALSSARARTSWAVGREQLCAGARFRVTAIPFDFGPVHATPGLMLPAPPRGARGSVRRCYRTTLKGLD